MSCLCHHNFEWLASSAKSIGSQAPVLRNWDRPDSRSPLTISHCTPGSSITRNGRAIALGRIRTSPVIAFCVHDCYANHWLEDYPRFIEELRTMGELLTFNQLSDRMILLNAE